MMPRSRLRSTPLSSRGASRQRRMLAVLGAVLVAAPLSSPAQPQTPGQPTRVAAGDDGVATARSELGSGDIVVAREELAAYAAGECNVDVDPARLGDFVVPTTLPLPSFSPEPAADAPDQGATEDVLSAVGFVIAEAYRIAITVEQAACVGARAADDEASLADDTPEQTHEWTVNAFADCGITTVLTTVLTTVPTPDPTTTSTTMPPSGP